MTTSLRSRLKRQLARLVGLTLALILIVGFIVYGWARRDLLRDAEQELELRTALRISSIESYLETAGSEVVLWSDHGPLREALDQFSAAWRELGPGAPQLLQRLYITENPYPDGERYRYLRAPDGSTYNELHALIHPRAQRFLSVLGYYDAFLIDPEGNVLYSYFKEEELATNLLDGPWRDTELGVVFRAAREMREPGAVAFSDFERYPPSQDAPSAFLAGPLFAGAGQLLGVLALQISAARINEEMAYTEGMGTTGENYIVGSDRMMRSDSRFFEGSEVLDLRVDTEAVRRALDGQSGVDVLTNYRDAEVVSAYGPVDFEGFRWAVVSEIELDEVLAPARKLRRNLLLVGLLALLVVAAASALAPGPLTRNP